MGYILTLLEGGLEDPSINKRFLQRALKGVNRMNKIIIDLDMITRFESSRIRFLSDIHSFSPFQYYLEIARNEGLVFVFRVKFNRVWSKHGQWRNKKPRKR
ncbi:hypothetical protein N9K77_01440 [bacterium]|nr:hypothetical protein [bacterium]